MSIRKYVRMKYDKILIKYDFQNKLNTYLTSENIRIFAWCFILSRIYHIYQLYLKEMFLNEILLTLRKKQMEHLHNVKQNEDFDLDSFLKENNFNLNFDSSFRRLDEDRRI